MSFSKDDALQAIIARIKGEWDNPSLLKVGPLDSDVLSDISYIIDLYYEENVYGRDI